MRTTTSGVAMTANPALLLILGAAGVPLLRGLPRRALMAAVPVAGLVLLWGLPEGTAPGLQFLGLELMPVRVDALSRVFATGFLIAALLTMVYAMHLRDTLQQAMTLVYAAAAVGGTLAGDLVTLFVFWELAGLSSAFLIWAGRNERSHRAATRYLAVQLLSGLLMLAGIVLRVQSGAGLEFGHLGLDAPGGALILAAIGIKCAFPLLHSWLTDTYPEATIVGAVALSAFTTKFAVYTLARGFAGTEMLVWVGLVMAVFPIFYAVIENDLRRVLAYSMINQLGFMVVGVGIPARTALGQHRRRLRLPPGAPPGLAGVVAGRGRGPRTDRARAAPPWRGALGDRHGPAPARQPGRPAMVHPPDGVVDGACARRHAAAGLSVILSRDPQVRRPDHDPSRQADPATRRPYWWHSPVKTVASSFLMIESDMSAAGTPFTPPGSR
ncbi:hypothetical protein GUY59_28270 [Nonomuraea sp. K271]|nr:hypothetical protein [Nonomuraea sp. K271]